MNWYGDNMNVDWYFILASSHDIKFYDQQDKVWNACSFIINAKNLLIIIFTIFFNIFLSLFYTKIYTN